MRSILCAFLFMVIALAVLWLFLAFAAGDWNWVSELFRYREPDIRGDIWLRLLIFAITAVVAVVGFSGGASLGEQ